MCINFIKFGSMVVIPIMCAFLECIVKVNWVLLQYLDWSHLFVNVFRLDKCINNITTF